MTRKTLRIGAYVGSGSLVLALLLGVLAFAFFHKFYPPPPPSNYPKPANALEAQRQDIDFLRKLVAMDKSFSADARRAANARLNALEGDTDTLPPQMFRVAVMQIVALADNGHTHVAISTAGSEPGRLPIRVTRFADGFYVMRAKKEYADMLGGRVESIGNVPIAEVVAKLETLRGGLEPFRRDNAAYYMVTQDLLFGLGIGDDDHASTWSVALPNGAVVTRTLPAAPLDPKAPFPQETRYLSPVMEAGMGPEWVAYRPASGRLPRSLQNLDQYFVRFDVPGSCARYVRVKSIVDEGEQKISPFLDATLEALRNDPPCAVILDLRFNDGGNFMNSYAFAHALPGALGPNERIYVLTDPETFSAALSTAAFVKDAGGARVTILGEPVGDRLSFYSEGGDAALPNSKLSISYATGRHDYRNGCTDISDCLWVDWYYSARIKTLLPDETIPMRFKDWNAGHDMAYERAIALAATQAR